MRRMAIVLMSVICVGIAIKPVSGGIEDPPEAQSVNVEVKHELTLRKLSRNHDSGEIRFEFFATGFENNWVCWSKNPKLMRLTDGDGKSLFVSAAERRDHQSSARHEGDWDTAELAGYLQITERITNDQLDRFGVLEVVAEITVALDLEYIDLGELKGLDEKLEIAPNDIVTFRATIEERSFSFLVDRLDESKGGSKKTLVGIETFDSEGKPNQAIGKSMQGFPGVYSYRDGRPMPHTGRLVFATRLERIPLKLVATDVALGGMSLKDVETITVEAMEKKLAAKVLSEGDLKELVISSVRLGREDLANVLVDAGAPVTGRVFTLVPGATPATSDPRATAERLFLRHIEVADRMKNQDAIDEALSLSIVPGYEKFLAVIMKCRPQLIAKHSKEKSHLITMRVFRHLIPEIADAYAHEVLTHGPDFEFATRRGFTEFLAAAYMGDNAKLAEMVKAGADVNQKDDLGENALDWACVSPHTTIETVKWLLDVGVETGKGTDGSRAVLVTALERKRNDLALVLIPRGAFTGITSGDIKAKALQLGAGSGSVDVLNAILACGVPIDWVSAASMIQEAGKNGSEDVLRIALERVKGSGLDGAIQKRAVDSGLAESAHAGKVKTVKMLLEAGADFSAGPLSPILARAAERPDDEIFDTILAEAVKKNLLSKIGQGRKLNLGLETMIAACGVGKTARVEKLIELGVVPTGEANESGNVLTEAARSGSVELVKLLLDKGVDVNAPGRGGNAIFWAAGPKWSPELLQLLASKGADVKIAIPRSGRPTVISNALASGDEALVKEVLKLGAPISVRIDSRVHDVLADAIFRRDVKAVQILLRVGVKPGNCEGAIGPSGNVSNHLDLARQMVGSVDSAQTREILKLIEEAGK